jgi:hypothetical protein
LCRKHRKIVLFRSKEYLGRSITFFWMFCTQFTPDFFESGTLWFAVHNFQVVKGSRLKIMWKKITMECGHDITFTGICDKIVTLLFLHIFNNTVFFIRNLRSSLWKRKSMYNMCTLVAFPWTKQNAYTISKILHTH